MRKLTTSLGALGAVLLGSSAAAACDAGNQAKLTTAAVGGWSYHGSTANDGEIILAGNSSSNSSSNSNSNSSSNSNSNSSSNSNSNSSSNSNSNSSDGGNRWRGRNR